MFLSNYMKHSALDATILFLSHSDTSTQEQLDVSLEQTLRNFSLPNQHQLEDLCYQLYFFPNSQLQASKHFTNMSQRALVA